jgi:hypothetical protein
MVATAESWRKRRTMWTQKALCDTSCEESSTLSNRMICEAASANLLCIALTCVAPSQ